MAVAGYELAWLTNQHTTLGATTAQEAERLMELIRHFYLHEPGLVQAFNETPDEFDFNRFIAECP